MSFNFEDVESIDNNPPIESTEYPQEPVANTAVTAEGTKPNIHREAMSSAIGARLRIADDLPSHYKGYKPGVKWGRLNYNFAEIEYFSSTQDVVDGSIDPKDFFNMMLDGITDTSSQLPASSMYYGDFSYISLLRKAESFGTDELIIHYTVNDIPLQHVIDVNTLVFRDLEIPGLPLTLPTSSGINIEFEPITIGKFIGIHDGLFDRVLPTGYSKATANLAACVTNMSLQDAYTAIIKANSADDLYLLSQVDALLHIGLDPIELPIYEEVENPAWSEDLSDHEKQSTRKLIRKQTGTVTHRLGEEPSIIMPFHRDDSPRQIKTGFKFGGSSESEGDR